uniref:NADH-ubiquinone oxidoreductase chain 2 n=1 Tax=Aacanthocnema dobsoni TaxID=399255 RepID=A0A344A205_9HEMI|nr:NADH dehydrogenase subunit 2 [Aacanthocnema dobsoni]AWU48796.1 NADH dehydrogenase subunit 2 [Aacanthocnema dobsoni]
MYLYTFIVLPLYFLSIIFSLSSMSWMLIWIGMEMNLLTFVLIIMKSPNNMMKSESTMKYFLIQSIGSMIFLLTIHSNMIYYNENSLKEVWLPSMALMLKSGMAPLHSWTPDIINKFSLFSLFLFISLQKIVPLMIMFSSWFPLLIPLSMINVIVGNLGSISQSSITKMIIFSSINTTGWMIMSFMESYYLFLVYFIQYTLISYFMYKFLVKTQIKWLIQVKSNVNSIKWFYFTIIMSMSGFPPFVGFIPKWLLIKKVFYLNSMPMFLMIMLSILTLFFYLKSSLSIITNSSFMKKWKSKKTMKISLLTMINIFGPLMFFMFN